MTEEEDEEKREWSSSFTPLLDNALESVPLAELAALETEPGDETLPFRRGLGGAASELAATADWWCGGVGVGDLESDTRSSAASRKRVSFSAMGL